MLKIYDPIQETYDYLHENYISGMIKKKIFRQECSINIKGDMLK